MLQNAYLLAKIGADTAEIEQHSYILPKNCQKLATTLRRDPVRAGRGGAERVQGCARGPKSRLSFSGVHGEL